jgi:hypothetical protein
VKNEEEEKIFSLPKQFSSGYAQLPRKYSNIEILAKIEGK